MFNTIKKRIYLILFSVYKKFKYPKAQICTNFIMPGVKIGQGVIIRSACKIQRNVIIDDYTSINENTQIDTNCKYIGKYCSISHGVRIGMGSHPIYHLSTSTIFYEPYRGYVKEQKYDEFTDKGYTVIGHDVLIGTNVIILAGVKIGDGAVIGAGSVVTKDVPDYAIVAGSPAKIIKYRFNQEIIKKLKKLQWWNMDISKLTKKVDLMGDVESLIKELELENSKK